MAAETQRCIQQLDQEWSQFASIVEPGEAIIRRAGHLADSLNLRGYDSGHLAAAEALSARVTPAPFRLAGFDNGLAEAARSLGLAIVGDH